MRASIQFGSKKNNFTVVYSNRKTLGITVTPDLDVLVNVPIDSSLDEIKASKESPMDNITTKLLFIISAKDSSTQIHWR